MPTREQIYLQGEERMANLIIVYWRDIPAQVIVKQGRTAAKRELPERFVTSIDAAAMKAGARDTDSYLADWRRDDLEAEAAAWAAKLEAEYPQDRLVALAKAGGYEEQN
jgi:hypothetical protein